MNVLILAGGLGTRIQPLYPDLPKGMIAFAGKPFLEYQMRLLARSGFQHFVLCVGHRREQIVEYFGDGSALGLKIEYAVESIPLGTAGALRNAAKYFRDPVLVMNGDTFLEIDYRALVDAHAARSGAIGTLAVVEMADRSRYGQIALDADGRVGGFAEKVAPKNEALYASCGVYVLEPRILEYIQPDQKVSLELEVFPAVLAARQALYGFRTKEIFVDIGTPEGYRMLKSKLDPMGS
jgi:NDP-sugar pyrophosphorylase family protein